MIEDFQSIANWVVVHWNSFFLPHLLSFWNLAVEYWYYSIPVYLFCGVLFCKWSMYADYYPRSLVAKILYPKPPFLKNSWNSPYSKRTPKESERLKSKYGSFKKYADSLDLAPYFLGIIFIIPGMFSIYIVNFLAWVVFILRAFFSGRMFWFLLPRGCSRKK